MTHKKEYKFNFAECMKFFVTNINACVDRHNIDISPEVTVTFGMKAYSYPYNSDVMNLIKKTFEKRRVKVAMSTYQTELDEKKRSVYLYKFTLTRINNTE